MPQIVNDTGAAKKRARLIGISVGIVLIVAILGAFLSWKYLTPTTVEETAKTINKAKDAQFEGNHDAAIESLKEQLKTAKTDNEKISLYANLGSNYEAKGDFKSALAAFHSAEEVKPTFGILYSIARLAEQDGDKATALEYYEKCKALITDGKNPQHAGDLDEIEAGIARVKEAN